MYGKFAYIYHKNEPNVGKYTSPMDPMGWVDFFGQCGSKFAQVEKVDASKRTNNAFGQTKPNEPQEAAISPVIGQTFDCIGLVPCSRIET